MATVRRKRSSGYLELGLSLVFLAIYLGLANLMEGLNFDTIFIALFCTLLSSFIVRCTTAFFTGR
jgi:hypothetical protein